MRDIIKELNKKILCNIRRVTGIITQEYKVNEYISIVRKTSIS